MLTRRALSFGAARTMRALTVAAAGVALGACSSLLDVSNPNNVGSEALDNPSASAAIVAGAENSTARALASILNPYTIASDETYWVGSRDAYYQIDQGAISDPNNEYVNSAFFNLGEARWLGEQAITQLAKFNADGTLSDKTLLIRAYLNGAVVYTNLADQFNDMTFSDRTNAGPNIGEANMVSLYDSATKWLTAAAALNPTGELKNQVYSMRARAAYSKSLWQLIHPVGKAAPANPLINNAAAVADANTALAGMTADERFDVVTTPNNRGDNSGGGFGFEMNSRVEQTPDTGLATTDPNSKKPNAVTGKDPVTGQVDAALKANMLRITNGGNDIPLTQTSQREMYLILAEAALAAGNNPGFDTNINALRALDGKAAYTGAGPSRQQLLIWERRVNLIFQGRRLNDMYRFGITDPRWLPSSPAASKRGCEFNLPISELQSNAKITGSPAC
jgi:hypothetical protein